MQQRMTQMAVLTDSFQNQVNQYSCKPCSFGYFTPAPGARYARMRVGRARGALRSLHSQCLFCSNAFAVLPMAGAASSFKAPTVRPAPTSSPRPHARPARPVRVVPRRLHNLFA